MAVIIQGVDLPRHCAMCPYQGEYGLFSKTCYCKLSGSRIDDPYKGRASDCPMEEAPEIIHCAECAEMWEYNDSCWCKGMRVAETDFCSRAVRRAKNEHEN